MKLFAGTRAQIEAQTSPFDGQIGWATDEDKLGAYTGTAWTWLKPNDWGNVIIVAKSGGDYTTIGAAISAASAGYMILIMPGDYTEDVTLVDDVHLIGATGGAFGDAIQGKPAVQIIGKMTADTAASCTIANLTIYHTDTTASDINAFERTTASGAFIEVQNCNIVCLNYGAGDARAVYVSVGSTVFFRNCRIDSDSSTGTAYGAYLEDGSTYFFHCVFGGNQDNDLFVDTSADVYLVYTSYRSATVSGSGSFFYDDADAILESLKTVDGAGSGLIADDSDKVDSFHASATPGASTVPVVDASSRLILPGLIQVKGTAVPSSGSGLELFWTGVYAGVLGYNRTGAAYLPVRVIGSEVYLYEGTTEVLRVDGGQVGILGAASNLLTVTTTTGAKGADIGNAFVGVYTGGTTYACFAHTSLKATAASYALIQNGSGATILNAASGQVIDFRINNATRMYLSAGTLVVSSTYDIRVGGGIYLGGVGTDPNTGDVWALNDGRFGGGVYVGSTGVGVATGEVRATVAVSGYLPFSDYSGNGMSGLTATTTVAACSLGKTCTLKSMYVTAYVATTNNGSNYWTIALKDASGATLASVNTSSGSAGTWTSYSSTGLSVSLTVASNDKFLYIEVSKTGSPGALSLGCPSCFAT